MDEELAWMCNHARHQDQDQPTLLIGLQTAASQQTEINARQVGGQEIRVRGQMLDFVS